jgi:2-hydroxychromene-2-carboxylate isomerase
VSEVRFFFGAMSPYSWFAAERIDELIPRARWRPVFAGALFRANGRSSWGLGQDREAGLADCEERARQHGLGPIVWPEPWPTNDVLVARVMAFAEREDALRPFALEAMRGAFLEGGDLEQPSVIAAAARRAGLDPTRLAEAVAAPEIKQAVRATHDEAISFGVFGVPTVLVGEQLFWGDDQLQAAADAASGL